MTAFLPGSARAVAGERDHPKLQQRPLSRAEQKARWEVRAAQWRARELAESIFGSVSDMGLTGLRSQGALRGLLRLGVPFEDLDVHRAREARFLAAVETDPILADIRLVYVIGPDQA